MQTVRYRIHPGIGIARLGNHPNAVFLGPEAPGVSPKGPYKQDGMIKRQAVRFRVFKYTYLDGDLSDVREVTQTENTKINWSVHLVNKKAESKIFPADNADTRRNSSITKDRFRLIIDAGNQSITGTDQSIDLSGSFLNVPVVLGALQTDREGRLIAMGGFGKSQSVPPHQELSDYANNDNWCDDTSDGPVTATIEIKDGDQTQIIDTDSAWLVVAPPSYAPSIYNVVTWYDRALNAAVDMNPSMEPKRISFVEHILPILARTVVLQWVDEHAANGHGPSRPGGNFLDPGFLKLLSSSEETDKEVRQIVYENVDDPDNPENFGSMPSLNGGLDPDAPVPPKRISSRLTNLQRRMLRLWVAGRFESDLEGNEPPAPTPFDEIDVRARPAALDRAALEDSIGLSFYPGIESSYLIARNDTYDRPLRVSPMRSAGDLTAGLAVPWQADFNACGSDQPFTWWPAARPNEVFRMGSDDRTDWVPESFTYKSMVDNWWRLGFIVRSEEDDRFVEVDRDTTLNGLA